MFLDAKLFKLVIKYTIVLLNFTLKILKFIKNHKFDLNKIEGVSTVVYQYWNNQRNTTLLLGFEPRFTGWKPVVLTVRR